jgi:translation initiation factor eIF-2B subunit epsilon
VILARSCKIGKKSVLGRETSIGDGSVVRNSIIGRRCNIGKNVIIENAYIWDDVVIGDGSTVDRAIVANEAVIGKSCYVKPGTLISFSVRISDEMIVKEGSRITRAKRKRTDIEGKPLSRVPSDPEVVGASGEGYLFQDSDEEDTDDDTTLQSSLIYSTSHLNLSSESISTLTSDFSAPSESATPRSRLSSFIGSVSEDEDGTLGEGGSSGENFHKDAVADVYRTLAENGDFHNTRVEFTSLRLSNNATDHHVHRAIAVAFTKRIASLVESGLEASKAVSQTLNMPGAVTFLSDVAVGRDRKVVDQVDFLLCVQKDLTHRGKGEWILFALCKELYEREVVEEEGFEAWWKDRRSSETEELVRVRGRTEVFMDWLREAEEEDSDEEEEDDDE